jgi:hypothetical protein
MQMIPTSFALTNRTTGTPRDLSVDANRTGVTRGLRKWDVISLSSHDFSANSDAPTEAWWWITNGGRGHGGSIPAGYTGSGDQNMLGALKVGGGLVYSHNVFSLNCTSLFLTTTWVTGPSYTHLWVVAASNDQVNWTEMATGAFSDATKMTPWTPNASDGGILWQGPGTGPFNRFYKLSWTNTQFYVYWRFGIKTAGTPMSGPFCDGGGIYEIEWS